MPDGPTGYTQTDLAKVLVAKTSTYFKRRITWLNVYEPMCMKPLSPLNYLPFIFPEEETTPTTQLLFLYDFKTLFLKMKINNIVLLCVFCIFSLVNFT